MAMTVVLTGETMIKRPPGINPATIDATIGVITALVVPLGMNRDLDEKVQGGKTLGEKVQAAIIMGRLATVKAITREIAAIAMGETLPVKKAISEAVPIGIATVKKAITGAVPIGIATAKTAMGKTSTAKIGINRTKGVRNTMIATPIPPDRLKSSEIAQAVGPHAHHKNSAPTFTRTTGMMKMIGSNVGLSSFG
jgi:hypothetical protein